MNKPLKVNKVEVIELEKVYVHQCMTCKQNFNDTDKPIVDIWGTYWGANFFDTTFLVASQCKVCMKRMHDFHEEKLKTVSNPFVDDNLSLAHHKE